MNVRFKKLVFFTILILGNFFSYAQFPTACFEIESILVDACNSNEGHNEMVRFRIGPNDMNIGALDVTWANGGNDWYGTVQNATTANKVLELNSSVENCGLLIEPTNGVLPAGSRVLLVTSYLMDPLSNSFENLNDTILIVFQDGNELQGHFANYGNNGIRTLEMEFMGPGGCVDEVSYEKNQLIDQDGLPNAEDGATVSFDWDGNPTYTNLGCQAPITAFGIEIESDENSICAGDVFDLSAITLNGSSNVTWQGGQGNFIPQNTLETTYESSLQDTEPFYLVGTIENACNFELSDSVLISINPAPAITVLPQEAEICGSETLTLTATGGENYMWSTGEFGNSIEIDAIGIYYAIDNSCGVDTAYSEIFSGGEAPTAEIDAELTFCEGETITITASGGFDYLWNDNSTDENLEVDAAGTYSVIVSDLCGSDTTEVTISQEAAVIAELIGDTNICIGENITLTANGGDSYLWNTDEVSESITITTGGVYSVEVTTGNCSGNDQITIEEHNPTIDLGNDVEACLFNSTLTVSEFDSYEWQDGSNQNSFLVTAPGIYTLEAVDEFGCTTTDEIEFTIGSILVDIGEDRQICVGEELTLIATSLADATYEWQNGSTNEILNVTETGTYSVEIEQGFCNAQDEVEVVFYSPTAYFELEPTEGCAPLNVAIQDQSSTSEGIITSWNWNFGDGTQVSGQNPGHQYTTEGNYSVSLEIITSDGCVSNYEINDQINVLLTPQADFDFTQEQTENGLDVEFNSLTTQTNYWDWSFGDNTNSDIENPNHLYINSGSYAVTLTVGLANGCSSDITYQVFFEPEHYIYIPTAFTPNNDGVNDYFIPVISGGKIATYELGIYSRAGQRIFYTEDPNQLWMGGKNSAEYYEQNDVYIYLLKVLFEGEAEKTIRKGKINLLR